MGKKKVLIGFSGNLEANYVVPEHVSGKKILLNEGDDEWGIGGTSVDVAIGLKTLDAPASIQLLVNVGIREDFRRMELSHYLTEAGLNFHMLPVLTGTNRAIIRRQGTLVEIAGRKHKYAEDPPSKVDLKDLIETYDPDVCVATGGMPSDVPFTSILFEASDENVLNPRLELVRELDLLLPLLARTTLLQINGAEMAALLGTGLESWVPNMNDFNHIHAMGPREVIVTVGRNGSFYSKANSRSFHQPCYPVTDLRDKTGAGDSFLAGFLTQQLEGADIEASIDFAARVAACKMNRITGANMPDRVEVDSIRPSA